MPVQIPRRSPWANQRLVLWALLHREAVTRFGQYKLGVVWLITEPLISVLVMGLLLGPLVGRTAPDMPYAFFLLNGFMHLLAFSGPLNSGIGAISSNHGLLVFPKVQPFDLLLARFLFDLMSSVLSFTAFCIVGMWMGVNLSLGYLHTLLATFILSWMMGSGIGWMTVLLTAAPTLPHSDGAPTPAARASRATTSSNTTVMTVSSTNACTEISVNRVTNPALP